MFKILFHKTPLGYANIVADLLISLPSYAPNSDLPFIIYEDNPECLNIVKSSSHSAVVVYLLDNTALSAVDGASCILDLIHEGSTILVPWSHRVGDLKAKYPKHEIHYLALPVHLEDHSNDHGASDKDDVFITFTGSLESRLSETYEELKAVFDSKRIKILNLNNNEDLLKVALEMEELGDAQAVFPQNPEEITNYLLESKLVIYPHNSSLRDIHWSYLYCLKYRIPALLGLKSDLESIPKCALRYYLGLDEINGNLELAQSDSINRDALAAYVEEIHSSSVFTYELGAYMSGQLLDVRRAV